MKRSNEIQARIERFRELHEQNPGSRYFAPLADLLRQDERYEEALSVLGPGLDAHGDYLAGLVIRGRTLLEMGRRREGFEVLNRVLAKDPDNVVALEYLAETALEDGQWRQATGHLEALCRLLGEGAGWDSLLQEARAQATAAEAAWGDSAEPDGAALEAVAQDEASFDTMTLVDIYLAQGYRNRALSALRRMLPTAGDEREAIQHRIDEIERPNPVQSAGLKAEGQDAVDEMVAPILGRRENGPGETDEQRSRRECDRAQRRDAERRQFEEWLEKIRFNGGHGE